MDAIPVPNASPRSYNHLAVTLVSPCSLPFTTITIYPVDISVDWKILPEDSSLPFTIITIYPLDIIVDWKIFPEDIASNTGNSNTGSPV